MVKVEGAIRIGGGSGFWGDSDLALPQFLACGDVDYVAFDYLAEITMSILARARQKSPEAGYALDFVTQVVGPNLKAIAATGTKIENAAGAAFFGQNIRYRLRGDILKLYQPVAVGG